MALRPEERVQKACLQTIHLLYPAGITFHIPNQRFGRVLRIILASLGVRPGMPDLGVLRPFGRVGWIEFKTPEAARKKDGGLTKSQQDLHPRMAMLWHNVNYVHDIDQIQLLMRQWRAEDAETSKALADV